MVEFKIVISDPKTGKTVQKEIKDQAANAFLNKKIREAMAGEVIDLTGYEFMITGGSDKSGFPMRKGISGVRKGIVAQKGSVGFKGKNRGGIVKGLIKKKTVCGETINENISQINLKITKPGNTNIFEEKKEEKKEEGKEEKKAEAKPAEKKEKAKEEKPAEEKEEKKPEEKKEAPKKEEKQKEGKVEKKPEAPKKEEKPAEKPKEEAKPDNETKVRENKTFSEPKVLEPSNEGEKK